MVTGNTFESCTTGNKYHTRSSISCKMKNLVSLSHIMQEVWPTVCQRDGEHAAHQSEWKQLQHKNKEGRKPVAACFCQPDHTMEDLQVRGIEKIHRSSTQWRREREALDLHPQNAVSTWVESGQVTPLHMLSQRMPSQHTLTWHMP